jgi:hypothetical protein
MEAHPRLAAAAALALAVIGSCILLNLLQITQIPFQTSLILGFDAGALLFLIVVWTMMTKAGLSDMQRRARIEG